MPVFSRILGKVSRWELPSSHFSRRVFSSPSLSPETNHELACDSGQDRSASRSLKDVAAPYGLFDQETEQSDFATQLSEGKLGATRALKQSGSNCNLSNVPSGAANVLAPASSSPGATLSCLNVGNHNEQLGSYCKSSNVPAPSGPTNVLAPASPSPGATLSCLNVGNHNEQSGSLCKSTNVSAPSGPAFTLAASSTTGATLSCLNVDVLNERLGSNRESDWILAQRGQRAPSPKTWAAENGNDPISSQSSTNKTARATLNTLIMSGSSASPTKNLDNKGATNNINLSGKSASSAVNMGGTAASSTAKSVLTVHGGTAASSTPSQSHDSSSSVSVTVDTAQRLQRKLCPNLSKNVTHDAVEPCVGGTATSSTPSQSHGSSPSVSVTVDTAQRLQRKLCPNLSMNVTHGAVEPSVGGTAQAPHLLNHMIQVHLFLLPSIQPSGSSGSSAQICPRMSHMMQPVTAIFRQSLLSLTMNQTIILVMLLMKFSHQIHLNLVLIPSTYPAIVESAGVACQTAPVYHAQMLGLTGDLLKN